MCPVNNGIEDTEHYLLHCNSFREQRYCLLTGVNDVLEACGHSESADINTLQLLLYRNKNFAMEVKEKDLKFDY